MKPLPVAWRVTQVLGGLALGLGLAEAGFRWHDDGAFPHLNLYVADPKLGVRLEPGGTQRISYGGNPVTTVSINSAGYRGAEWGAPAADEIVVIGDSQVFGLGVEAEEAAAAEIGRAAGRPVRNAGVPTYGPVEYLAVLDELLAARKPKTVVLVLNFSNDLFEIDAPNTGRHAVWDGWAVRIETAPDEVVDFPGRRWIYNDSHLFFALRRVLWAPPEDWSLGVASEGTWSRVLGAAEARTEPAPPSGEETTLAAQVTDAAKGRDRAEDQLMDLFLATHPDLRGQTEDLALEAVRTRAQPGDIVSERFGSEAARSTPVTAELLKQGAKLRAGLEAALLAWADANPKDKKAAEIRAAVEAKQQTDATLQGLAARVGVEASQPRSPLEPVVRAARDKCAAAGAELVVAALPLDVQVSDTEWAKYGAEPKDMTETRALLTDLVSGAERMGVRAVDLTDALAAAQPGAFLPNDLHLSPKGQAAVGQALAARIAAPAPLAIPGPGLADGRTRVPTNAELALAPEITVKGSSKAHCSTRQAREWLYVYCTTRWGDAKVDAEAEALGYGGAYYEGDPVHPLGVAVRRGEEALVGYRKLQFAALLTPLVPGRVVEADFWWTDRAERLSVTWEADKPEMAFSPLPDAGPPVAPEICKLRGPVLDWVGDLSRGCSDTYETCEDLRACGAGTRAKLPTCPEGQVNAGSAGHCHDLCSADRPCDTGQCVDWVGGRVCL
jgi:hypothetical protein